MIEVDYEDFIRMIKAEAQLELIKKMVKQDAYRADELLSKIFRDEEENEDK